MRIIGLIIFIAGMGIGIGTNISTMLHLESAAMVVGGHAGVAALRRQQNRAYV